ncbi:hypothetical protein PR202_gb03147 [Eleusine coracana subsp. coracana]|uniref:Uncharacterized protein n=1 Tax=Eleusine coracana subsp. coracana TaxID=191504 RepID=A0AAV5E0F6_ELECO|nr:hypothetical protein PR202_gb03147 [Eleusine coracana subsp. coracana]
MTSMLIYLIMAIDFPQWVVKVVDKIRRWYLWRGREDAKGGHYLFACDTVYRPPGTRWPWNL